MTEQNIDHDRLFKELISTFFIEFIDLFLPEVAIDIDRNSIQFLPETVLTDVTKGEKKIIDLLAKVKYRQEDAYFLIHVEAQSYTQQELSKRIFKYFARLHEKYDLPIYPVVIFSFDEPKRLEPSNYQVKFPSLNVLDFNFAAIQLNQLSWRDYLTQQNPVAAALMAKMNMRLLTTLRLDPARMQLISGFVGVYLELNAAEEEIFQDTVDRMGLNDEEVYMEMVTSWERKAIQSERRETISDLLKLRFGNLDPQLEAIIPHLMELSRSEYLALLMQTDRSELLSRFHG